MRLDINLDVLAVDMADALENSNNALIAYRHEPGAVRAIPILKGAAGVRAVCNMIIGALKNDVSVNPHQVERFTEFLVNANKIIESFNSAVTLTPFVRQNGTNAGMSAVVHGEVPAAPPTKAAVIQTAKRTKRKSGNHRGQAKLPDDDIRAIRRYFAEDPKRMNWQEYAMAGVTYGVSAPTIHGIVIERSYNWVK